MAKKYIFGVLAFFVWAVSAPAHHPVESAAPLHKYTLSNHRHLHASFLMMKKDSVYLETEKGAVKVLPLSVFSKADQKDFLEKKARIERLNEAPAPATKPITRYQQQRTFSSGRVAFGALSAAVLLAVFVFWRKSPKWKLALMLSGVTALMAFTRQFAGKLLDTDPLFIDSAFEPFKPNVATHWDSQWFYVESNGIPTTHLMMTGITAWQQQVPLPQCYIGNNAWQIPLHPELAANPVPVNQEHFLRGAVAIAANGIAIFNPHTNTGIDAYLAGQLDQWGGHSGRADDYHYHIAPMFLDTQSVEILPIAFALDGFAVYASHEPDGAPMLPLDENHGHFDADGVYHYHGTPEAPYMIGNMVGKVTEDATLQIIPQASAMPVRPSLTPLNGAVITNFQSNGSGNGYILTYTRNGQTYQLDYSWTETGTYTYHFTGPNGTNTETYNGHLPCQTPTATSAPDWGVEAAFYPNPAFGGFSLKISGPSATQLFQVEVFDASGRMVHQTRPSGTFVELPPLAPGVYWVKAALKGGEFIKKIVVAQ